MTPKQETNLRDLIMNCHNGIIPYVNSLPAVERAVVVEECQTWRSMENEKPARWQFCIVAVDDIVPQAVLAWDGERFVISFSDSEYPFKVTHWMPLPPPPTDAAIRKLGENNG